MKTQKQIILGIILLVSALLFETIVTAQAIPCDNNYFALTYSPNDLNEGELFNLRFTDIFGEVIGQSVWLDYSNLVLFSGDNPQTVQLTEDYGQAIWSLNSSVGGVYTVNVIIPMTSTQNCTVEKEIEIYPYSDEELSPQLIVTLADWNLINASTNYQEYPIKYENIGTGRALNISSFFNSIASISYSGSPFDLNIGDEETIDYNFNNSWCGEYNLSVTTNYQNEIGEFSTPINNYDTFNISGSDLQIINAEITDSRMYDGEDVVFLVNVTNNNRTLNGIISSNAEDVRVYFNGIACSVPTTINVGDVTTLSCSYHLNEDIRTTTTRSFELKVISENECSNWNNDVYDLTITIYGTTTSGGGGGSSGSSGDSSYVPVCGNKICESGETETNCATDCNSLITPPAQTVISSDIGNEEIIIYSKDKLAFLKLKEGTKAFMENLPIKNVRDWVIIENGEISKKLPYGYIMIRQYEFIPNGLEFIPDATVGFAYDYNEIKNGVYIAFYDLDNEKWIFLDSNENQQEKIIETNIQHFSNYALVTKQSFSLTGFYLLDSVIGAINENLWINLVAAAVLILGLILFLFSLFKKRK